jgi:hypothetical protein
MLPVIKNKYLLLCISLIFLGCHRKEHRYPEDPAWTRIPPKKRLVGIWRIVDFKLNNVSIIDTLNAIPQLDIREKMAFSYATAEKKNGYILQIGGMSHTVYYNEHAFDDYHYLNIGPSPDTLLNKLIITPFRYQSNSWANWAITKLYENDLHLQLYTDTGEYRIFLYKQQ